MHSSTPNLAALLVIFSTIHSVAQAQTCYWPNGEVSGYKPCSSKGGPCCYHFNEQTRDACYINGICHSMYFGYMYRGACTDKNWGSTCPDICKGIDNDQVTLRFCKPIDAWCCQPETATDDCCSKGQGFQWRNASLVNQELTAVSSDFDFGLAPSFQSTTGTAAPAGTATTSPPRGNNGDSNEGVGSNCNSTADSEKVCSNSSTLAVGAGLGVGLGVPLLVALAGLLWMHAKQRALKKTLDYPTEYQKQTVAGGPGYENKQEYVRVELHGEGVQRELQG